MKIRALRKPLLYALVLLLAVAMTGTAFASAAEAPIEIHTVDDMLAMAQNPKGHYILMADLDMGELNWIGPDFTGTFDGNGHAILNLTMTTPGKTTQTTYDGNVKAYESSFVGLFSTLENATVRDLKLINVRAKVDSQVSIFVGAIAGYTKNATISGCTVTGILDMRAFDRMFGIGGLVGYGSGSVDNCTLDVTLISTDTQEALDEMFLGGLIGMGFFNMTNCTVNLDGYGSEYGYVHSGGLIGMLMYTRIGSGNATISGNTVNGKITFFECNTNRRAYCEAFIGEALSQRYKMSKNKSDFKRDERKVYVELRPETCEAPVYSETVTAETCNSYGYTTYQCGSCAYTYTDHYTLFGDHQVSQWNVLEEATVEKEGISTGTCGHCGAEVRRTDPKLAPPPTQPPTEPPATTAPVSPQPEDPQEDISPVPLMVAGAILVALVCALVVCLIKLLKPKHRGRFQR